MFEDCGTDGDGLSINIPEGLKVLPENAFSNCKIKNITLPKSLIFIQDYAFSRATFLNDFVLENLPNLTYLGSYCFVGVNANTMKINLNNINILSGTFGGICKIEKLFILGNISMDINVFSNRSQINYLDIRGVTFIKYDTFRNAIKITKVILNKELLVNSDLYIADLTELQNLYVTETDPIEGFENKYNLPLIYYSEQYPESYNSIVDGEDYQKYWHYNEDGIAQVWEIKAQ